MDGYLQRQEEEREQGGFGLEQALEEEPESLDRNLEFLSKEQKSIETEQDLLGREQEQIDQDREFLGEYQQHLIDFFKPNMP
jgi:hypothetical protein